MCLICLELDKTFSFPDTKQIARGLVEFQENDPHLATVVEKLEERDLLERVTYEYINLQEEAAKKTK